MKTKTDFTQIYRVSRLLNRWFSTFLTMRHINFEKKSFEAHLQIKREHNDEMGQFLHTLFHFEDSAAHLEKFNNTIVRRDTLVEKH